jgi:putative transposase
MRKSRSTEAQIIGMIKEQEAGMPTAEVCRKHGLSQGTFYKFKSKYGGMEVSDAAKLKALEDENAKLKRLLADQMLDNVVLKDLLGKSLRRRMSGVKQRSGRCGIMTSRSAGPADLSVSIQRLSGVSARRTILRYAKR